MIDAVLSYHMNPQTCGVAKFNQQLAQRLGVPMLPMRDFEWVDSFRHPLLSIKSSEVMDWEYFVPLYSPYDLFFHDAPLIAPILRERALTKAGSVYAANKAVANALREKRSDIIEAFCPSTVEGNAHRGSYNVLAFGMAHKLAIDKYRELKQQLEIEHPDYTVSLSTAVHEGSPWDTALTKSTEQMRAIFGDKLRVLGYLGDDALAKELQDCSAVAVYFDPAVRENNTSVWAALSAGKPVYTNTDEHSPELNPEKYSWDNLLALLR